MLRGGGSRRRWGAGHGCAGRCSRAARHRRVHRVGPPGQPEPIAVGPDGRIYVGTNQLSHGDAHAPSKVFAYSRRRRPRARVRDRGPAARQNHGIQGLVVDGDGLLYALDRSADPRVIVLDPATGEQRDYARFRDVPPCGAGAARDRRLLGHAATTARRARLRRFAPSGDLYVTDIDQALIWRVPAGGGQAGGLADRRAAGERLRARTGSSSWPTAARCCSRTPLRTRARATRRQGRLYTVAVEPDGRPGQLAQVWESRPLDAPDGIAIARSGNVYVALAGASQSDALAAVRRARTRAGDPRPTSERRYRSMRPGSLAFLGDRVLVATTQRSGGTRTSWAILDVFAGEPGLPLHYPRSSARAGRERAGAPPRHPDTRTGDPERRRDRRPVPGRPFGRAEDEADAEGRSGPPFPPQPAHAYRCRGRASAGSSAPSTRINARKYRRPARGGPGPKWAVKESNLQPWD